MASFHNTEYVSTISSLTDAFLKRLDNPFYKTVDKDPVVVQYYNINSGHTTMDEATRNPYNDLGVDSPIKYNLIKDAVIYGSSRLELDINQGDFGLESEGLESESYILPNSWIPYPGDFFTIDHSKGKYLFKVIAVNKDTLDNGANFYRITWKYDRDSDEEMKAQIQDTYQYYYTNDGTNVTQLVRKETFDLAKELDEISFTLKTYFRELFYDKGVQTFIYEYNGFKIYDPYMIEFIKRVNLLFGTEYMHVLHQLPLPATFVIDYNKTFMHSLEEHDKNRLGIPATGATLIRQFDSLFSSRYEDYYCIDYCKGSPFKYTVETIPSLFISNIKDNTELTDPGMKLYNIIMRYYNNEYNFDTIKDDIYNLCLLPNNITFYGMAAVIYIIDSYVRDILSSTSK